MPQSWAQYWSSGIPADDPIARMERDRTVQMLGNLALVNERLNPALSNHPWLTVHSPEATELQGKKDQPQKHSLMRLTRDLIEARPLSWDDEAIKARSEHLAHAIVTLWPRT